MERVSDHMVSITPLEIENLIQILGNADILGSNSRENDNFRIAVFDAKEMRNVLKKEQKPDLIFLSCFIGLGRGNNIDKIRKEIKGKRCAEVFNKAIRIFCLKKSASGARAVTLSRIIACFPEVALSILNKNENEKEIAMPVNFKLLKAIHAEYPRVARHGVCASIIPESLGPDTKKALDVIMVPYLMNFEVFNASNSEWKRKSNERKIYEVAARLIHSWRTKVFMEEITEKLAIKFGLVDAEKKLSPTWHSVSISAKAYLKENYNYSFTDRTDFCN